LPNREGWILFPLGEGQAHLASRSRERQHLLVGHEQGLLDGPGEGQMEDPQVGPMPQPRKALADPPGIPGGVEVNEGREQGGIGL
jgi:hypothetical protein